MPIEEDDAIHTVSGGSECNPATWPGSWTGDFIGIPNQEFSSGSSWSDAGSSSVTFDHSILGAGIWVKDATFYLNPFHFVVKIDIHTKAALCTTVTASVSASWEPDPIEIPVPTLGEKVSLGFIEAKAGLVPKIGMKVEGSFRVDAFNGGAEEQPEHLATVADFYLDRVEVSVGRFRKFVSAFNGTPPPDGAGAHPLIAGSGWQSAWNASLPASQGDLLTNVQSCAPYTTVSITGTNDSLRMNCASWFEAFAFCIWDGGRLPTEAEWEYDLDLFAPPGPDLDDAARAVESAASACGVTVARPRPRSCCAPQVVGCRSSSTVSYIPGRRPSLGALATLFGSGSKTFSDEV